MWGGTSRRPARGFQSGLREAKSAVVSGEIPAFRSLPSVNREEGKVVSLDVLKRVIVDNRRILEGRKIIPRELRVPSFPRCLFIGGRGVGKTHCLFAKMKELLGQGRSVEDLVYIDFYDERLDDFDRMDFNKILIAHAELTGKSDLPILFLDEVQQVECWEMLAARMSRAKASVYIAASPAGPAVEEKIVNLGGPSFGKLFFL